MVTTTDVTRFTNDVKITVTPTDNKEYTTSNKNFGKNSVKSTPITPTNNKI